LCVVRPGGANTSYVRTSAETQETIDGWRRGELAVYIADGVDGRSETSYYLRDTLGGANFDTRLLFDTAPAPELVTGVRVKLRGVEMPDGLRVTDYALLPAAAAADDPVTSAL